MFMSSHEFVLQFKALVGHDDESRIAGCVVLMRCLEDAIHDAAGGNPEAMSYARFCAKAVVAVEAETILTQGYFEDYHHVARILASSGEVEDTHLAFEVLEDFLSLRIPPIPAPWLR